MAVLDRRLVMLGLPATAIAPGAAQGQELRDQPALPKPLGALVGVSLRDHLGRPTTLGALIGQPRPAVISFWASWCAPCAVEGRHLAGIRAAYPEDRLAIIGINVDAERDAAKMEPFRRKAQMNYQQALGREAYGPITGSASVLLPRTYLFDRTGRPVAAFGRYYGAKTTKAITAAVERAVRS